MRDFLKSAAKFVGGLLLVLAIAGGVTYGLFMAMVVVGHNAMAPSLVLGDRVLIWKTQTFELGQAALCRHPSEPSRYVMGRVSARAGQTIEIDRSGTLQVNGSAPDREVHANIQFRDLERNRVEEMVWAEETMLGHDYGTFWRANTRNLAMRSRRVTGGIFLLSDNRTYIGEDSRTFGPVAPDSCVGRVFMRISAGESPSEVGHRPVQLVD